MMQPHFDFTFFFFFCSFTTGCGCSTGAGLSETCCLFSGFLGSGRLTISDVGCSLAVRASSASLGWCISSLTVKELPLFRLVFLIISLTSLSFLMLNSLINSSASLARLPSGRNGLSFSLKIKLIFEFIDNNLMPTLHYQ